MLPIGTESGKVSCTGQGANGAHCCYINGQVCEFLYPWINRCSLYSEWGSLNNNPEWVAAPVGQFFTDRYPGFDCGDWPQNIPTLIEREHQFGPFALCCFGRGNRGNLG